MAGTEMFCRRYRSQTYLPPFGDARSEQHDALVAGTTNPEVLADLALGKLRKKIPALRDALQGRFEPLHALLISSILAHLDFLDEQITGLSEAIEEQIALSRPPGTSAKHPGRRAANRRSHHR